MNEQTNIHTAIRHRPKNGQHRHRSPSNPHAYRRRHKRFTAHHLRKRRDGGEPALTTNRIFRDPNLTRLISAAWQFDETHFIKLLIILYISITYLWFHQPFCASLPNFLVARGVTHDSVYNKRCSLFSKNKFT